MSPRAKTIRATAKRSRVLPASIPAPQGPYAVVEVPGMLATSGEYGRWDYDSRTIMIDADVADDIKRITLEHEIVHVILYEAEIALPEKKEEKVCEAIAAYRVYLSTLERDV
jgi:hypothetical protein